MFPIVQPHQVITEPKGLSQVVPACTARQGFVSDQTPFKGGGFLDEEVLASFPVVWIENTQDLRAVGFLVLELLHYGERGHRFSVAPPVGVKNEPSFIAEMFQNGFGGRDGRFFHFDTKHLFYIFCSQYSVLHDLPRSARGGRHLLRFHLACAPFLCLRSIPSVCLSALSLTVLF